jgi:hypothetical protein
MSTCNCFIMETIGSRLIMHLLRHCNIDSKILSLVEQPSPRDNRELPHQIATQALFKGNEYDVY